MKSCLFPVFLLMVGLTSYAQKDQIISLNGNWNYRFDKDNLGISEEWYKKTVSSDGLVQLPGTTDTREIGPVNPESRNFISTGPINTVVQYGLKQWLQFRHPGIIRLYRLNWSGCNGSHRFGSMVFTLGCRKV